MLNRYLAVISGKHAARPVQSLSKLVGRFVLLELPACQLLVIAAVVGAIWSASTFDLGFLIGQDAFWQFPMGTIRLAQNDMAQVLVGYLYFVQSPWHLPLFYVSALGTPAGTNVIFTDFVPVVGLAGKFVRSLTGATVNPYGAFLFLCFALPGVMMTLLLIAVRIRYGLAAVIAAVFADTMPALLWRWGHIALEAQFLLIGALALYLFSVRRCAGRGVWVAWISYLIVAYLTDNFLFMMVGTVWLCAVIQRRLNRLATTRDALGTGVLTVALVTAVIALGGQFSGGTGLPYAPGYGFFSMNLLSPVVPQNSGLFPMAGGLVDATGGQYEGFNYLGIGLLLASALVLPAEVGWLRKNLRRHMSLAVACTAFTALSISNRVFAGHQLLFELPTPLPVIWAFGIFRASGRLFWLVTYLQMAIVIALGFRRVQPVMALCLLAAAVLQLFDVQPLREQIIASIAAGPGTDELDRGEVARLIAQAHHVEIVPSFQCNIYRGQQGQKIALANMELMLAMARINVSTNTVYTSRESFGLTFQQLMRTPWHEGMLREQREGYCERELDQVRRRGGRPGDVFVLLSDRPRTEEMAPGVTCSPLSWARYCVRSQQ